MATRIRLQRRGRKNHPFYQIIVADSRAPRDGKYVERIGSYNPNTNPATITLDFERALYWLQTGAEASDTVRNILSNEGVLMKKHLLGGVAKGAFTEEEANSKYEVWVANKQKSVDSVKNKADEKQNAEDKARFDAEKKSNQTRADELAKKKAAVIAALEAEKAAKAPKVEEAPAKEEAPIVEEAPVVETPVEETPAKEVPTTVEEPAKEGEAE
ncbi:MAG: 30S ribosomal protein S16 [Candidatus Saccharimonadaceae bacterium]